MAVWAISAVRELELSETRKTVQRTPWRGLKAVGEVRDGGIAHASRETRCGLTTSREFQGRERFKASVGELQLREGGVRTTPQGNHQGRVINPNWIVDRRTARRRDESHVIIRTHTRFGLSS